MTQLGERIEMLSEPMIRDREPRKVVALICDGVVFTEPAALHDIPSWCRVHGHRVLEAMRKQLEQMVVLEVAGCCAPRDRRGVA